MIVITPQEAGQRSDPTHVTYLDPRQPPTRAAAGSGVEAGPSFPFPRPAGRVFTHNESSRSGAHARPLTGRPMTWRPRADLRHPLLPGCRLPPAALDSVVAQTDPRWRAVVIDDAGPEPEAGELVERCGDERITYVRNDENLGLAGNWNRCLDVTTTALVTILHADDALEPGYGEAVVAAHKRHPGAVAVHTRARIIGHVGQPVRSTPDAVKHWIRP